MARTPKPWFRKGRGWFVTIQGTQHNLGRDKKTAFQEYHRLMRMPTAQQKVSAQSLAAIFDDFLEFVHKNNAEETYRWYKKYLQKFISVHKSLRVDDIRPFHVQRWVDSFPHLGKNSRRNHLRAVKRCLRWATMQGYIDKNPIEFLHVPAGKPREVVINMDEYQAILEHAKPDSFRDLIVTTWETGCRPQESLRVESRHVDFANQRWVIPPGEAKGDRFTRIIYLTDKAMSISRRLVDQNPEGKLFRNAKGLPWNTDSVNCAFDRLRFRMGKEQMKRERHEVSNDDITKLIPKLNPIRRTFGKTVNKSDSELRSEAKRKLTTRLINSLVPRYSLYGFRHSFATHALERGVDSVTVAVLMGHTDPSMLARVYQHLTQNPQFLLQQLKLATAKG